MRGSRRQRSSQTGCTRTCVWWLAPGGTLQETKGFSEMNQSLGVRWGRWISWVYTKRFPPELLGTQGAQVKCRRTDGGPPTQCVSQQRDRNRTPRAEVLNACGHRRPWQAAQMVPTVIPLLEPPPREASRDQSNLSPVSVASASTHSSTAFLWTWYFVLGDEPWDLVKAQKLMGEAFCLLAD